jgi:hypothetical protein
LLLGLSTKSTGEKEAVELRRVDQWASLESRLRAARNQVQDGSQEAIGLDKAIEEVRYFDKNTVSQYDTQILSRLLDLESLLFQKDESLLPEALPPAQGTLNLNPGGPAPAAAPQGPPPVTDPPAKIIDDIYKLAVVRHQDSTRSKRGGF